MKTLYKGFEIEGTPEEIMKIINSRGEEKVVYEIEEKAEKAIVEDKSTKAVPNETQPRVLKRVGGIPVMVKAIFPDGRVKIYESLSDAGKSLGVATSYLSVMSVIGAYINTNPGKVKVYVTRKF